MKKRVFLLAVLCLAGVFSLWAAGASQQSGGTGPAWPPNKNIEILCSSAAGSGTDGVSRIMSEYLAKTTGRNFYVVNDNAGAGTVAYERMRTGPADGTQIGFAVSDILLHYYYKLYDHRLFDDFTLITMLQVPVESIMVVVRADSPYKTLDDLLKDAKARPNMVSMACGSMGQVYARTVGMENVFGVTFRKMDGSGNAERMASLLGGHTDWLGIGVASVDSYVQNGQVRYLAYYGNERSPLRPDVPCIKEMGYTAPEEYFSSNYYLVGPKNMSEDVANAIAESLKGMETDEAARTAMWNLEKGYPRYLTRPEALELAHNIEEFVISVTK